MNARSRLRNICAVTLMFVATLGLASAADAHGGGHGGGGGGAHGSGGGGHFGGGHFGGFHGGGRGIYGMHGAYGSRMGGWRGGGYGGYGGWGHGGWGHGGWGRGGWGAGWLGYGLLFSALPYAYSTLWWDGVPYYYADDNYYQWNDSVGEYETVQPPAGLAAQAPAEPPSTQLFAYPKNAQSSEQQAKDKQQCATWATTQTDSQANTPNSTASPSAEAWSQREKYLRAEAACLEGRGYSVR